MRKSFLAFILTFYQLFLVLAVTGGKYTKLVVWDAQWYRDISVNGYNVKFPLPHYDWGGSNIAFFPGFPVWVHALRWLTGFSPDVSVSLAAELACIGCWVYFFLLGDFFRVQSKWILLFALIFILQPGSFYTVIGYSEALFSMSLLGFVYWTLASFRSGSSGKAKTFAFVMSFIHGGILTATRFVGVPLVGFPLLVDIMKNGRGALWRFGDSSRFSPTAR